jgi:glycosyltransferase involved in cell wall biosynthesis
MTLPLVTVVIPTYNRAHLLAGAVESVLAQTYRDYRVLISDNLSTDDTASVVGQFDDPRLVYTRRDRHIGLNEHFSAILASARSRYLFVLPDDDRLLPDALAELVPVLESNAHAALVHARARLVDDAGAPIVLSHDMCGLQWDTVEQGPSYIGEAMKASHRVHASTVLFRTEAIQQARFDERDYPATDLGLWLRLALDWNIAFLARTVAIYRVHANTYTSRSASVGDGGYVQSITMIENIYRVKLRFLEEYGHRLDGVRELRRAARRARREQLVNYAAVATGANRRPGTTVRTLVECAWCEPRVMAAPGAWRLVGSSLLGRRLVDRLKGAAALPPASSPPSAGEHEL